jgi:hypothetical protein
MIPARYSMAFGLACLVPLFFPSCLLAEEVTTLPDARQVAIEVGIEYFRWQEFDDDDTRLLTEQGPRFVYAAALDNRSRPDSGIIFAIRLSGYVASVDYDGQDTGRRFVATTTDYHGWGFRIDGGYRFAELVGGAAALDLFGGIGMEQWTRDIQGSVNALGLPVQGLAEDYAVRYARAGLGIAHEHNPLQGYLSLGFRRPLSVNEDVELGGVPIRLHPGKRVSSFANYKVSLLPDALGRPFGLYLMLYYESYRFRKSGAATVGNLLVWQPRSDLDRFGIMIGHSF